MKLSSIIVCSLLISAGTLAIISGSDQINLTIGFYLLAGIIAIIDKASN